MPRASTDFERYGDKWPRSYDDLRVELESIARGGRWEYKSRKDGKVYGAGLFTHYMNARKLLWPERYRHRWTDLVYKEFIANMVTILMGAGSTQKTSHASEFALISYWAKPDNTLVLLSTTTREKLDMAVFGEVKMLFNHGRRNYPWLAGHLIESKQAITTDAVDAEQARDMRKGIIGRACYVGRQYVGLGVYAGIKQENVIFIGDELQFMPPTFLDCLPNMMQNPNLKVIGSGNPKHDPSDQLGLAAEPKDGYGSLGEIEKTTIWNIKFERGRCVNLVGTDSPNFDVPEGTPPPFPRLINRETARRVETFWGKDSLQYWSQCKGIMKAGMIGHRVITAQLCKDHNAHAPAIWAGTDRKKAIGLDAAWGGKDSDRCVAVPIEWGLSHDGIEILKVYPAVLIPIFATGKEPEDQIAHSVSKLAISHGIEPENIFYDSTGRGTLGSAFARIFGTKTPTPVEFGGSPSSRPVRHDLFIVDESGERRHKRCDEHYRKFVSELWFSVRYVIECDQMRELPQDIMQEGCSREYGEVAGNKIEVESKDDTIERMGVSPDLFDALATAVEGARQRGFKIRRLGAALVENDEPDDLEREAQEYEDMIQSKMLSHAA